MPALGSDVTSAESVWADFMNSFLCEISEMIASGRWITVSQGRSPNRLGDSLSRNVCFSLLIWKGICVSTSGRSALRGEGSQREIIYLWDVTRMPNTPVCHKRHKEYMLNPNVFPRKRCRTRWTCIQREHILSQTPWLSPHHLFLHQGKFSILLVLSRQQMPKQPQVRFYGTLHGKALRKLFLYEVHRDADCLPAGGRGSFSRGKVVKHSQMHHTTASCPRIYI